MPLPEDLARRYARAYGTRVDAVLGDARSVRDLGDDFGAGLYAREADYLVRNEWVETAEDILWRRTKLGLHAPGETEAALSGWLAGQGNPRRAKAI